LISTSAFVERFYKINSNNILSYDNNWQDKVRAITTNKNNVFIFEIKPFTSEIVNQTQNYRNGKIK
jgi:hypothetical protein